jgi:carboxyl-terminal processing protease
MKHLKIILIGILFIGLLSCEKEKNLTLNETIKSIMDEWYLWYDKMPMVNIASYTKPQDLIDALKYETLDRWSFIITEDEYNQYYEEGKYYGHGMGYSFGSDNKPRVIYVFKSSELYKSGVRRGWTIKMINGTIPTSSNVAGLLGDNVAGIQNTFLFGRPDATDTSLTFTKTEVKMDMILESDTFHLGNTIAGYLVLYGFIANAKTELENIITSFKLQGVSELIVDLRYNGGGWVEDAAKFGALIAGSNAENDVICKIIHNDKKTSENFEIKMETNQNSLNLKRVFFITTKSTASASELLINGLKPFIDVKIIGKASDGKPVGMYKQDLTEFKYVFFPIMFKTVNKNDEGDYYNGIIVDKEVSDDITHDFGSRDEACLYQALYYIEHGNYSVARKSYIEAIEKGKTNWWDQQFGAY